MFERLQNIFDFHPRLFSEVMWDWYDNYQLALDESTAYNYKREIIRTVQYFGEVPFAKVNTALIQEYITFLYEVNHLSSNTVYDVVKPIKFAIDYEISRHKKKKINPFDNVVLPKRMRVEIYPFSEAEMLQLLKQDYVEWVKDGIIIAYHTGMRLGEIYGLKWKDINFDESFIMVQRSQSRAGSKVTLKTTKTRYGV